MRKKRIPKLEDVRYTLKWHLIDAHYKTLEEDLHWTVPRYRMLCTGLSLTEHELGAFIRARVGEVERWLRLGEFPAPVELHLTLIERAVLKKPGQPLFPRLTCTTSTS